MLTTKIPTLVNNNMIDNDTNDTATDGNSMISH